MRKLLVLGAAIAAGTLLTWLAAVHTLAGAAPAPADAEWPGTGSHFSFMQHFARREENESARRLLATAGRFGESDLRDARRPLFDYIRGTSILAPPPPFLAEHANTIRTLRAQIVSNPAPLWALDMSDVFDPPLPPLVTALQLVTVLGADAVAQHAGQNDRAAWTDLRAAWIVSQSLWDRPEPISVVYALGATRTIMNAGDKIDGPRPSWWAEMMAFDVRAPLLRSMQYEAWINAMRAEKYPAGEPDESRVRDVARRALAPLLRPVREVQATLQAGHLRRAAQSIAQAGPRVDFSAAAAPEWAGMVERVNRFRHDRDRAALRLTAAQR